MFLRLINEPFLLISSRNSFGWFQPKNDSCHLDSHCLESLHISTTKHFLYLKPLQTKVVMDLRFSIFLSLIRKGVSTTLNTYVDKVFAKLIVNLALSFLAQKIGYVMMQPTVQKVLKPVNYIIGLTFTRIIFQRYVLEDLSSLY